MPDSFAVRLRTYRLAAKLTQEELAQRANVSGAAVRQWEAGRRGPSLEAAKQLARALGVDLGALAGEVDTPPRKR